MLKGCQPAPTFHAVASAIESLCHALHAGAHAGLSIAAMRDLTGEARLAHAASPFVRRLQVWPRGYPGDFETIEHLMRQDNRAPLGSVGAHIEQYCLATPIAQQHRNKVWHQANEILRTALRPTPTGLPPAILILAAGSAPDLRQIAEVLPDRDLHIVLNDADPDALAYCLWHLQGMAHRIQVVEGPVHRAQSRISQAGPYDLVLAGGLFDYLNDRWATHLLGRALGQWLRPGGRMFFTNIGPGNPYRLWMECIADWRLLERTEPDIHRLVAHAWSGPVDVRIDRDATGLTLLTSLQSRARQG